MFNQKEKRLLLKIARKSLEYFFDFEKTYKPDINTIPERLKKKEGTFVTITEQGNLKGCIGTLNAQGPLFKNVIDNAISAAFADPRFFPLKKEDLEKIKISISILTSPIKIEASNQEEKIKKIRPGIDGVIIQQGSFKATFLPKVWEELPDKDEFLSQLCIKAGLLSAAWRAEDCDFYTYQAEEISE